MNYLKLSTGEYALHEGDIRLEHPEIPEELSGDNFPVPSDYVLVNITDKPEVGHNQYLAEDPPVEVDGQWYNVWVVKDYTQEQLDAIASWTVLPNGYNNINADGDPPNVIG